MPHSFDQLLTDLRPHQDLLVLILAVVVVTEAAIILLWARRVARLHRHLDEARAAAEQARTMAEAALAHDRALHGDLADHPLDRAEEEPGDPLRERGSRAGGALAQDPPAPPREIYSVRRPATPPTPMTPLGLSDTAGTSPPEEPPEEPSPPPMVETGASLDVEARTADAPATPGPTPGAEPSGSAPPAAPPELAALLDDTVPDPRLLEATSWAAWTDPSSAPASPSTVRDRGAAEEPVASWVLAEPSVPSEQPIPPTGPVPEAEWSPTSGVEPAGDVEAGRAGVVPPPETRSPRPSRVRSGHEAGADVLLVEDDHNVARLYRLLLEGRGYRVRHAEDGVAGLEAMRRQPPSLVLLDVMMPEMNGIALLQEMRKDPALTDVPVVVLSNFRERRLVERAMELGALEYMVKAQARPEALVSAIPHWIRGERAFQS